jgi:two-component system NarL family response regulator
MGINILVADQERTFADALAARLRAESDIEAVGAVLVRMPRPWLLTQKAADVVLLDGDLPGEIGYRLCEELSGRDPETRVIMLASASGPIRIMQAIQAGAAALVRKDEPLEHLLRVIHGVAQGETWLPAEETGNVVRWLLRERDRHREVERLLALLTPRERAVLACLAEGTACRQLIAEQLHLSVNTVRTHLQNLMAKLHVHSALEAVVITRDYEGWSAGDTRSPAARPPGQPLSGAAELRRLRAALGGHFPVIHEWRVP